MGTLKGQQANVFHRPAKEAREPEVICQRETGRSVRNSPSRER